MSFYKIVYLSILGQFCLTFSSFAQQIPFDPAVRTGKLANGFTYYLRKNSEPAKRAQLYLINNVGSILEDDDQQGLAHFMEHMNFNGTKNFPKNKLVDYLQRAGVKFGADLNAHTGFDETVYELPVPTDDPQLLTNAIKIMRDWAQEAILDPVEIDKERGVVLEEGRLQKNKESRMSQQYFPMLDNRSRYHQRMPIGKDSILRSFRQPVLKRFMEDWYRPDLQALIVVGDINVDALEKMVVQSFSDLKVNPSPRKRTDYNIELKGNNQFMAVRDPEMASVTLEIIFKRKASVLKTESDYLSSMTSSIFNQMLSSRRSMEISRNYNPAYNNMGMSTQAFVGGVELFTYTLEAKQGQLESAFSQTWAYLERLRKFGFTAKEFQLAKQVYLRNLQSFMSEKDKTPSKSYVDEYKDHFLHQRASPGVEWENAFAKTNLTKITLEQINAILTVYLKEQNMDILLLAPQDNTLTLPDSSTVMQWLGNVRQSALTPFRDEEIKGNLLSSLPKGGKSVSRKVIPAIGATEIVLGNGIRVLLKPTDNKNDQILFRGYSPGGTSLYDDNDYDNAANAGPLMSRFGLGEYSPNQLQTMMNGKVVSVNANIVNRSQTITGSSSIADIETALQIAYLQFTAPRKDAVLFTNIIGSAKENIRQKANDPNSVFADTINMVRGNYSFRNSPSTAERLGKIDLDRVFDIYKRQFADASGFTFVFVGSFETEKIVPLLEKYLGSLPDLHQEMRARDLGIHIPTGKMTKKVFMGKENRASVILLYSGDYKYGAEQNMLLKALSDILQVKVLENLREREGEAYSPSVQVAYTKFPSQRFAINIGFGCAPENVDHLTEQVSLEMKAMANGDISADDLIKFKAGYAKNFELALKDNAFWLNYLSGQYENKEDLKEVEYTGGILEGLSVQKLKKAAPVFLKGDNLLQFILLPESSAK